jgi:hypothetical protein
MNLNEKKIVYEVLTKLTEKITDHCYSTSNRNEYQEYFLGLKAVGT